jgi:hypothetical protein
MRFAVKKGGVGTGPRHFAKTMVVDTKRVVQPEII